MVTVGFSPLFSFFFLYTLMKADAERLYGAAALGAAHGKLTFCAEGVTSPFLAFSLSAMDSVGKKPC